MDKKFLILSVVLLVCIGIVTATDKIGFSPNDFRSGTSLFNSANPSLDVSLISKSLDAGYQAPIVSDMNNDTINEIIVIDNSAIKIYNSKSLALVGSYSHGCTDGTYVSNIVVTDMDDEASSKELVYVCEAPETLSVLKYNTTHALFNISSRSYASSTIHASGQKVILMCEINKCLMAYYSDSTYISGATFTVKMIMFNETTFGTESNLEVSSSSHIFCPPLIRSYSYRDYNTDGKSELVFSMLNHAYNTGNLEINVYGVYLNETGLTPRLKSQYIKSMFSTSAISGTNTCRTNNVSKYITSPLTLDWSVESGLETVVGFSESLDTYRIYMINSAFNELDKYPDTLVGTADGILISNVVQANVMSDNSKDFCVFGYEKSDQTLDLLCGSRINSFSQGLGSYESVEFMFDKSSLWNFTSSENRNDMIIHSIQSDQNLIDGNGHITDFNADEITTTWGVFKTSWDEYDILTPRKVLEHVYVMPFSDSAIVPTDAENTGYYDLLALRLNNLWYIDDGFTNQPGQIDSYTINPCINSIWKINTTVLVKFTVIDDVDQVRARATLFTGTKVQDSNWSSYASSGTEFSFSFIANESVTNSKLALYGSDSNMPSIVDNINFTVSTGNNGVSFGDCITSISGLVEAEEAVSGINATVEPSNNNTITNTINEYATKTGLGSLVLWLIVMLAFALVVFLIDRGNRQGLDDKMRGVIIVLGEAILLVIGTKLGFISTGIIIILVLISIMGIGVWISQKFFHGSNNSGNNGG